MENILRLSRRHSGRVLLFVLLCALIILFLMHFTSKEKTELDASAEPIINKSEEKRKKSNSEDLENIDNKPNSATVTDSVDRILRPQEILRLKDDKRNWKRSRGYFDKSDYALYASYDDSAIRELANNGDLLALAIWSDRLKDRGYEEKAIETQMIAAMYGSSEALISIATTHQVRGWDENLSNQERLHHIKAMLVYAEVAAMRGDRNGIVTGLLELKRQSIELSQSELSEISNAAKEIFAGLEKQRNLLGLDSFDNHADPFVRFQMDYMTSTLPNPNGWATQYIGEKPEVVFITPSETE